MRNDFEKAVKHLKELYDRGSLRHINMQERVDVIKKLKYGERLYRDYNFMLDAIMFLVKDMVLCSGDLKQVGDASPVPESREEMKRGRAKELVFYNLMDLEKWMVNEDWLWH